MESPRYVDRSGFSQERPVETQKPFGIDPVLIQIMDEFEKEFPKGPSPEIDKDPIPNEKMEKNSEKAASAPGNSTLKNIGKFLSKAGHIGARVAAGVTGGAIVLGVGAGGALLSGVVALPAVLAAVPLVVLGAALGSIKGAVDGDVAAGAMAGGIVGLVIPMVPWVLAEMVATIPKAAVNYTIGNLGCGLLAFAITGKTEKEEVKMLKQQKVEKMGYDFSKPETWTEEVMAELKRKPETLNKKLFEGLSNCVVPLTYFLRQDSDKKIKDENKDQNITDDYLQV